MLSTSASEFRPGGEGGNGVPAAGAAEGGGPPGATAPPVSARPKNGAGGGGGEGEWTKEQQSLLEEGLKVSPKPHTPNLKCNLCPRTTRTGDLRAGEGRSARKISVLSSCRSTLEAYLPTYQCVPRENNPGASSADS